MANFVPTVNGDKCQKRVTIWLTREQNDFCMNAANRPANGPDDGGGKQVDEYLSDLLADALDRKMARRE
ncbi:MAG TPA: hypothetical protein VGN12_30780 [Pirellulales bacterium]|jgi:hypothetical protein